MEYIIFSNVEDYILEIPESSDVWKQFEEYASKKRAIGAKFRKQCLIKVRAYQKTFTTFTWTSLFLKKPYNNGQKIINNGLNDVKQKFVEANLLKNEFNNLDDFLSLVFIVDGVSEEFSKTVLRQLRSFVLKLNAVKMAYDTNEISFDMYCYLLQQLYVQAKTICYSCSLHQLKLNLSALYEGDKSFTRYPTYDKSRDLIHGIRYVEPILDYIFYWLVENLETVCSKYCNCVSKMLRDTLKIAPSNKKMYTYLMNLSNVFDIMDQDGLPLSVYRAENDIAEHYEIHSHHSEITPSFMEQLQADISCCLEKPVELHLIEPHVVNLTICEPSLTT